MAKFLNKDLKSYIIEKERFIGEIKQFHDSKGTPFRNIPTIGGKEIDLYLLYWLVTAQGGWEKINTRGAWDELLNFFEIDESTLNAALGIKQVYLRYLEPYEKVHYQGEDEDREDDWYNDEEDSRTRRQKAQKIQSTVPVTYNHNQHNISDEVRANFGLSQNLFRKSEYDRLALSLLSPLPNEQDFAINVCTLLSNEGKHTLKLEKCPRLLDLLLAHAGVYQHSNLKDYVSESYKESRNYNLAAFWSDVCRDESLRELLLHPPGEGSMSAFFAVTTRHKENPPKVGPQRTTEERLKHIQNRAIEEMSKRSEADDSDIFALGRQSGTRELCGHRVLQIATIIRNLSFEEENSPLLARSLTCLRFCLLCAASKWNNINQIGFDILSNIASDLVLVDTSTDTCVTEVLLSILTSSIASIDRFQIISSLDVLNKLSQLESNEEFIDGLLSENTSIYEQLVSYLSLHDIHLLIATLECIYAISCHGETTCNAIARTHGALETLVSLVSVEAQSYGPKACILMRVVETVPGSNQTAVHNQHTQPQSSIVSQAPLQQGIKVTTGSNGLKAEQLAQLGQLTPVRPSLSKDHPTVVTVQQANTTQGQLVQVPSNHQQPTQVVQLPRQSLPVIRPGQPTTVMVTQQQTFQSNQLGGGSIIITSTTPNSTLQSQSQTNAVVQQLQSQQVQQALQHQQGQQILQSQQVHQALQLQQTPVSRPQISQSAIRPALQQQTTLTPPQPTVQPPAGSQQVQLRVSNDDANRQFCLSWLTATYELAQGSSIDQQIMYKQYLASLHKLGKREVISAQHYAVCVRTLFGGSVGPNRKTLPDGTIQNHFEGVRVRPNPLPLRVMGGQQPASTQPQQSIVINPTSANQPGSPILTNLLHRKSPVPEMNSPQINIRQPVPHIKEESVLDGILPKDPSNYAGIPGQVEKKNPDLVNGIGAQKVIVNHTLVNGGIKRPSSTEPPNGNDSNLATPNKRAMLDCNGTPMMNGPVTTSEINSGQPQQAASYVLQQPQQVAATGGQKIVTGTDGKQYIVKTGPGCGSGTVIGTLAATSATGQQAVATQQQVNGSGQFLLAQNAPGGGKTIIILQPQAKVLSSNGQQVMVQNSAGQQMIVSHGTGQPMMVQSNTGQQVLTSGQHVSGQSVMVQSTTGQPVMLQNSTGSQVVQTSGGQPIVVHNQQVVVQNSGTATQLQAVTAPATVVADQQTNFNSRPQQVSSNVIQRPLAPTTVQQVQPQVPTQGVARVATPPLSQSPAPPAATPPPTTSTQVTSTSSLVVTPTTPSVPIPKPDPAAPFLCEWHGCMKAFKSPKEVEKHAITTHCPAESDDIPCLWLRCDGMKRKRFSMMTHLQDRHCHPQLMKLMAVRRVQMATTGKSDVPLPPAPPPHPGYAPNAALHAIKRHAQEFVNPKAVAMGDEKEGPVTKSIRLTASLILKNLVTYSPIGKRRLRAYESHLSTIALSNVESSRTVSQILYELSDCDDPQ